jgi:3-hydroxyacyl-CoA dehydrogenase
MLQIGRAAVLGAGTMGATIAAHMANAGIQTLLLDIAPKELTPDEEKKSLHGLRASVSVLRRAQENLSARPFQNSQCIPVR